jgi:hypothetical protein
VKLPSHTTMVAYLALFVALGGSAYAATQLPRNSVGSKQLKPNAVTAAKLKNGAVETEKLQEGAVTGAKIGTNAVTGANVDESSLGRVPGAASAESATTAGHAATATNATNAASAADAKALGGVPGSGFLRTNAIQFRTGALNACFKETLAQVPGWFEITTVGNCQPEFKVKITNLSSETWQFISEAGTPSIGTGGSSELTFPGAIVDLFAISTANPNRHALIDCVFQETTLPPRISCSTRIPPAA